MQRTSPVAALCVLSLLSPIGAAAAQPADATTNYYVAPKLIKRGDSTSPVGGPGSVLVKVLVNKDGTFKVQGIISSTNHGDDKAALEIANSSTYRPARKGTKVQTAFYDFRLKFNAAGASTSDDTSELGQIERMIRAGNFSGAKTKVDAYLQAHPGDAKAQVDLGLADAFLNDFEGAAAAFDKGGTIPQNYRTVAGKSYAEAAVTSSRAKDAKTAVAYARKAVALTPGFGTYNALGFTEYGAADYAAAAGDLEKARALAVSEKISDKTRALLDLNLASAYLNSGNLAAATKVTAEGKQLDPTIGKQFDTIMVNYYGVQAKDLYAAKKFGEAATMFEQAAVAIPSQAAFLYAQAAKASLFGDKPDNIKAKADADKALALDPGNALAYYAAGVSMANQNKSKDALDYLKKADDAAKKDGDTDLATQVEAAIKRVGGK
jgi:tetratricopeptide (TPR) repeat protein